MFDLTRLKPINHHFLFVTGCHENYFNWLMMCVLKNIKNTCFFFKEVFWGFYHFSKDFTTFTGILTISKLCQYEIDFWPRKQFLRGLNSGFSSATFPGILPLFWRFCHFSGDFVDDILTLNSLNTWPNCTDLKQNTKYKVNIKSISIIYQYRVRKHNLHPLKLLIFA